METVHQLRARFAEALDEMEVLTARDMSDEDVRRVRSARCRADSS